MKTFFRTSMRYGAPVLFAISIIVFLVTLAGQFLMGNSINSAAFSSDPGQSPGRLWFLLSALGAALSSSAVTFFGACIIDRIDRALERRAETRK